MTEKQFKNKDKKEYQELKLTNIKTKTIKPFGELVILPLEISKGTYDKNFEENKIKLSVVENNYVYIDLDDFEYFSVKQLDGNSPKYYTWHSDGGKYAQCDKLDKIRLHEYLMYPDLNKDSSCEVNHMNGLTFVDSMRNLVKVKVSKGEKNHHGYFTGIMGNLKTAAETYLQKLIDANIDQVVKEKIEEQSGQKPETIEERTKYTKRYIEENLNKLKENAVIKYSAEYLNQNVISPIINEIPLDKGLFRTDKEYREAYNTKVLGKYTELMQNLEDNLKNNSQLFSFSFEDLKNCINLEEFYTISSTLFDS